MKTLFLGSAIILATLAAFNVLAHGDHGPTQVQPTKGGVIQKAETFFVEAVGTKTELKLYPLREEGNPKALKAIPLSQVTMEATVTLPRGKATPVTLTKATDHLVGKISAGSAHRYQVDVKTTVGKDKDSLTFQVEPQE